MLAEVLLPITDEIVRVSAARSERTTSSPPAVAGCTVPPEIVPVTPPDLRMPASERVLEAVIATVGAPVNWFESRRVLIAVVVWAVIAPVVVTFEDVVTVPNVAAPGAITELVSVGP